MLERSTVEAVIAGVKSKIFFQHIENLPVEGGIRSEGKRTLVKWNHFSYLVHKDNLLFGDIDFLICRNDQRIGRFFNDQVLHIFHRSHPFCLVVSEYGDIEQISTRRQCLFLLTSINTEDDGKSPKERVVSQRGNPKKTR